MSRPEPYANGYRFEISKPTPVPPRAPNAREASLRDFYECLRRDDLVPAEIAEAVDHRRASHHDTPPPPARYGSPEPPSPPPLIRRQQTGAASRPAGVSPLPRFSAAPPAPAATLRTEFLPGLSGLRAVDNGPGRRGPSRYAREVGTE